MATNDIEPQAVRSRRNRERRNHQDGALFEMDASSDILKPGEQLNQRSSPAILTLVPQSQYLGYFSTSALILNKMFGTGIFVTPAVILKITNSKSTSLLLWFLGGLITWAGLSVYLEYGIRFPLNGGELYYIEHIWTKPRMLFTYMYSFMFIVVSGSQANALTFGKVVLVAATKRGADIDTRLQKFFAILVVGFICLLQAFSRINYVRFSNHFAVYKITLLTVLTILGWCVLGGHQLGSGSPTGSGYGRRNLRPDFSSTNTHPYNFALALLSIMRVFLGYENANFVLEEVRRPPGDEPRVYRRAAKYTVLLITFFYLMVNVAFFAACSTHDLITQPDTLTLFFDNAFGASSRTRTAAGVLQAISAFGNIMSYIYSNVRVKQEIARLGIMPYPEFWAKTNASGAPGPALLLVFIFTTIMVIASPLHDANGYLIISTLFTYERTWVSIFLGLPVIFMSKIRGFRYNNNAWRVQGTRGGSGVLVPWVVLWVAANAFVLVFLWWPNKGEKTLQNTSPVVPSIVGPILGIAFFAAGALYWLWDLWILNALGYTCNVEESEPLNGQVRMLVIRSYERRAKYVLRSYQKIQRKINTKLDKFRRG